MPIRVSQNINVIVMTPVSLYAKSYHFDMRQFREKLNTCPQTAMK